MPYLSLPNFNYDSGPRRIQSGPDHEGYVVLYSGVQSTGPDEGIVVAGAPLSGTLALGAWDYDANWRYVPSTLPSQSGVLNPTPYNVSGALDTYEATRIYTRNTVAGAQIASAIGPEAGAVTPRGGALQPGSNVTQPEKYMYFGGAAPDNQNYSPYNTPDANSAAEGKTGGGVTHKTFESSLLTNVLGGQGTSDRSQWRYHQPVYCKTYTETKRSEVPGLMSTPLRAVYRGGSTSYNYNYGGELLANKGGFELLPYDSGFVSPSGCGLPLPPISTTGFISAPLVGDVLTVNPPCPFISITWFNTGSPTPQSVSETYTVNSLDITTRLYAVVTYLDSSNDTTGLTGVVLPAFGSAYEGGFLGPLMSHTANGIPTHALIIGPIGSASTGSDYGNSAGNLLYKTSTTADPFSHSLFDGLVNTNNMLADVTGTYPAANFCGSLTVGGYTDWYLPSIYEMLAIYYMFKPTATLNSTLNGANPYSVPKRTTNFTPSDPLMTPIVAFQRPNSQHWGILFGPRTSNEGVPTSIAYGMDFGLVPGSLFANDKTFMGPVRAIRQIVL